MFTWEIVSVLSSYGAKGVMVYRIRLGCAAYARMNIIPRQTTVCLGGAKGGFSSETHDVQSRNLCNIKPMEKPEKRYLLLDLEE